MTFRANVDGIEDDGAEAEFSVRRALFGPLAGADPMSVIGGTRLPGCRYRVADAMLRDPRLGPPTVGDPSAPLFEMLGRWMIRIDGDRHREIRARFGTALGAQRVIALRPTIERFAGELLDRLLPLGAMELVGDFARPLPLMTILRVLGVPDERHGWIAEEMAAINRAFALQLSDRSALERGHHAAVAVQDLMWELLQDRARRPCDDLLSSLAATVTGPREQNADLVANCVFFTVAGHATTTTLIAGGIVMLLENPHQLAQLRRDPSQLPNAVEELLRLISPTTIVPKRLRDGVNADELWIQPGETRCAFLGAANRDPDVYSDPNELKLTRAEARHLAFGAGRHFCLGAPLARANAEIAIGMLLDRCQTLRLASDVQWRTAMPVRELERAQLTWNQSPGEPGASSG